jgi:adenosylmethionine-8-amino-7-oxononanoate aminotransferase
VSKRIRRAGPDGFGQRPDRRLYADGRDLATQAIFDVFLGRYDEFKTFFHGHSYTANQLGAAASLASLRLLESAASSAPRPARKSFGEALQTLWALPNVGDIRQVGLMAGVELVKNWKTRAAASPARRNWPKSLRAMARRGVLTRTIGNVIVLMPPYCTTPRQVKRMVAAVQESVVEVLGSATSPRALS